MAWDLYVDDWRYNSDTLQIARDFLESSFADDGSILAAYLGGSLAVGLGSAMSDVDIYAITAEGSSIRAGDLRSAGRRVNFIPIHRQRFADLVARGSEYVRRRQFDISSGSFELLVRLHTGVPLVLHEEIERDRQRISAQVVRQMLTTRYALLVGDHAEDCCGAVRIRDWSTALYSSGQALRLACQVMLAGSGDLYVSGKFLLRQLAGRAPTADLAKEVWTLLRDPGFDATEDEVRKIVEARMTSATSLIALAAMTAWDGGLTAPVGGDLGRSVRDQQGPIRSPWYTLVRFSDAIGLRGEGRCFSLGAMAATVFACADGNGLGDLGQSVRERTGADARLSERQVVSCLQQLVDVDVIRKESYGGAAIGFTSISSTSATQSGEWLVRESDELFLGWRC